jgi:hypothetical protein
MSTQIAKITHYYDKIGVAVIKVMKKPLKVGDVVKISGQGNEFVQTIESLQVEHKQVNKVMPGKVAGIKTDKPVKDGYIVSTPDKK